MIIPKSCFGMRDGPYEHAQIISNVGAELHASLKRRCAVLTHLSVAILRDGLCAYPDIAVVCDGPQFLDGHADKLLNPQAIVEVFSSSTEAADRGFKFAQYRTIASLQEYMLVSQAEARVEIFARQKSGGWALNEFLGLNAVCRFESFDCEIPLAEIYFDVNLGGGQNL